MEGSAIVAPSALVSGDAQWLRRDLCWGSKLGLWGTEGDSCWCLQLALFLQVQRNPHIRGSGWGGTPGSGACWLKWAALGTDRVTVSISVLPMDAVFLLLDTGFKSTPPGHQLASHPPPGHPSQLPILPLLPDGGDAEGMGFPIYGSSS